MEYQLSIYKADKRLSKVQKYGRNLPGKRCVGVYEFDRKDDASMDREVRELAQLYPAPQFMMEYAPKYRMVKNMMTGKMVQEAADTPYSCSVASESYWSN